MSERHVPAQFRVYPDTQQAHTDYDRMPIQQVLVFDCETTTDRQRLLFGSFKLMTVAQHGSKLRCKTRYHGLFYADDLQTFRPEGMAELRRYAAAHRPGIDPGRPSDDDQAHGMVDIGWGEDLELIPSSDFIRTYIEGSGYSDTAMDKREYQPATIVGFNLSFDMWRLVTEVTDASGMFYGGNSGILKPRPWKLSYREIKAGIGMRRELTCKRPRAKKEDEKITVAYLVDVAELVRALTGKPHSLESAGKHFGCRTLKSPEPQRHGVISHEYIAYNLRDVDATAELWQKATETFLEHPVRLRPDLTYSPASLSKQYLRDMGIHAPMCACKTCKQTGRGGRGINRDIIGRCMASFYGGRSECGIRMEKTPAVLVDFTSMYPTVMILTGIWELLTADRIQAVEETTQVQAFLDELATEDLYRPETWSHMCGIAEFVPDHDLGPVRSPYSDQAMTGDAGQSSAAGIGINYLSADRPVTWTICDLAANKLLNNGRVPRLLKAWRFKPSEKQQPTLTTVNLYGKPDLAVNPGTDNLLRMAVEQRQLARQRHKANAGQRVSKPEILYDASGRIAKVVGCACAYCRRVEMCREDIEDLRDKYPDRSFDELINEKLPRAVMVEHQFYEAHEHDNYDPGWSEDASECLCEACRTERFLKVFANAIYGVFAEMNINRRKKTITVADDDGNKKTTPNPDLKGTVHGLAGMKTEVTEPEHPGEYCFPPFATVCTGGARLMLAMLQYEVQQAGTSLVFCDTDSGCIPASRDGNSAAAIPLLSYRQVDGIRDRFRALNPYDESLIPDLLKWEHPARDSDGNADEVLATAISAKRYALYRLHGDTPELVKIADSGGSADDYTDQAEVDRVEVVKRSEHGLGLYMNPTASDALSDADAHGGNWYAQTWDYIIRRHVLNHDVTEPPWFSLPAISRLTVTTANVLHAFDDFNAGKPIYDQVTPSDFMLAVYPAKHARTLYPRMRLVGTFIRNPANFPHMRVNDIHNPGSEYGITTDLDAEIWGQVIPVKSYGDVIRDYVQHPERKYDDANGEPCGPDTRGRLYPAHVIVLAYQHITKDSSSITSATDAFMHYGPRVYRTDDQAYQTVIVVLKEHLRYTGTRLHGELTASGIEITEQQCRKYLKGSATPRQDVMKAIIRTASRPLRAEFDCPAYYSDAQVLSYWRHRKREAEQAEQAEQAE